MVRPTCKFHDGPTLPICPTCPQIPKNPCPGWSGSIAHWGEVIVENARQKGWHEKPVEEEIPTLLCLIHSEVSEALECWRKGEMETQPRQRVFPSDYKPIGFPSELADIGIRLFELAELLNIDLEMEIDAKHRFNTTRPYRHGGKKA